MDNEFFETEIDCCSSCGRNHFVLVVPMELPEEVEGHVYTHYTLCPDTGDEILVQVGQ